MSVSTNLDHRRIVDLRGSRQTFDLPLSHQVGGRVVKDVVVQQTCVTLESKGKKKACGIGEMTLGTAWAWPSKNLSPEQVTRIVMALCDRVADRLSRWTLGPIPSILGCD